MLDIKKIRQDPETVREALRKRNYSFDLDRFLALDEQRRAMLAKIEERKAARNTIDAEMKQLLKAKQDPAAKIEEGKRLKQEIAGLEKEYNAKEDEWTGMLIRLPNIPHESLPAGGAEANKILCEEGKIPQFDFAPADHVTLAEKLDVIDFSRAAKLAGSNFVLFKGAGARLERALLNFMLDVHTCEHGYREIFPPVLVNRDSMFATGQLPNLEEDMYRMPEDDLFLIPTAEVPVTNIHRGEILAPETLPRYYCAYTSCFRREAGSYGKETRGLMRVHQFDKVELVKFVKPENSYEELESLLAHACKILELLKIPYRVVLLATGDISFAAAKCYDIEIYAPGSKKWLEVSSCSNFEDFQARRGSIRYRDSESGKPRYVHTLNGSGVALARLVIALLEIYQQADGTVLIPEPLRPYMRGQERIVPEV
ncbi:MAG: serine--tRNA ligase [Candidatus Omnitrophica bacterium]|nr:serine--tRNA ligase [Candidatus Omnitrophota bacterium]